MYIAILETIKQYRRIIIHRHSSPDGDALGSQIGLKIWLKQSFPEKEIYQVGDDAGRYSFIKDSRMDDIPDCMYEGALAILLDTASPDLISDGRFRLAQTSVRFDHHLFTEKFADLECIDPSFESCCGLIADFIMQSGYPLTKECAEPLFTGMATDSGRFRYDSTSPRTFRIAAALLELGLDLNGIYRPLYSESLEKLKTRASFIEKITLVPDQVAYIYTTKEELLASGLDAFSASRGMVGVMADVKGIDIWVSFTETDAGVLCELRSARFNINPIAVKYGGGGHKKASGATLPDRETAMRMVDDLRALSREGDAD